MTAELGIVGKATLAGGPAGIGISGGAGAATGAPSDAGDE